MRFSTRSLGTFLACLFLFSLAIPWQQSTSIGTTASIQPIAHWVFDPSKMTDRTIPDQQGKFAATIEGSPQFRKEPTTAIELHNETDLAVIKARPSKDQLPKENLSMAAWVRVDRGNRIGGILSCARMHYDMDSGFFLGYTEQQFQFGLTTQNSLVGSDRNGKMTLLTGKTLFQPSKWYHVAATYDGRKMNLYVNGKLDATSEEQYGPIRYSGNPFMLGRIRDDDEDYPMFGALHEVKLYNEVLTPEMIQQSFLENKNLANGQPDTPPAHFVVTPYLQFPTQNSMMILWETNVPGSSIVEYGPNEKNLQTVAIKESKTMHEVPLTGLNVESKYVYRVKSVLENDQTLSSDLRTFQTAVKDDSAFTFAVIGDTQKNPRMHGIIAQQIWKHRPHFLIHNGDVVDNGSDKNEWVFELFHPMKELLGRVAIFPTIGNHEKNHPFYYQYFALPKPEYYYTYSYGNADFFVIDSNKKLDVESEQYKWLDAALGKSKAKWKFVYHHHPAFSSDDNDYGDTWKTNNTKYGDVNVKHLVQLYEKHHVDIDFNGHIHVYERSWQIRGNKIDPDKGVMYVTSGGGGANLENFAPTPAWFKAQVRVDYHFCLINIHDNRLEFKVFDQQNRMFDSFDRRK